MQLEIDIEGWPDADWEALVEQACGAAAGVEGALGHPRLLLSVLFTSDDKVHALNREWRGRDKPTNVLSFPMLDRRELLALEGEGAGGGPPVMLGDLALACETCAREADAKGVTLEAHAAHLVVHGLLHLAGHDHVNSDEEADAMEALEIRALAKMGVRNPYERIDSDTPD